jgi:hypothetical protein
VRAEDRRAEMSQKLYLIVSGFVFLLVAIFHLFRLVYEWPILVGPRVVPYWLSVIGFPVSLGYTTWAVWLLFPRRGPRR